MTATPIKTAALVIIGNEVLSGRTRDANLQYIAQGLFDHGVTLVETRVVRDVEDAIVEAVDALRAKADVVFTTGGIGPTHDDITAAAIAKALGRPFGRNPEAEAILRAHYKAKDLNAARLRMADMPDGATLIDNPVSRAPAFRVDDVIVLPGVPSIVRAMFDNLIDELATGAPLIARTVAAHVKEGDVAEPLAAIQAAHPSVEIGSYPFFRAGHLGTSLVARGAEAATVDAAVADLRALVRSFGAEPIDLEQAEIGDSS